MLTIAERMRELKKRIRILRTRDPYRPGGRLEFAAKYREKRYALCDWRKREKAQ